MKKNITTTVAALMISFMGASLAPLGLYAESAVHSMNETLVWETQYGKALARARQEQKPLFLFFTGSDWCTWCHRLEQEVLDTQEFAGLAKDRYVFVKLDFPRKAVLSKELLLQNEQLRDKYNIRGYPTVVLLDPQEKVIGESGYKQGGGVKYAQALAQMVESHSFQPEAVKPQPVLVATAETFEGLKRELILAMDKGDMEEALDLADKGLDVDKNDYFLRMKYALLVKDGKLFDNKTRLLKDLLIKGDPDNAKGNHFHIAVTEFEQFSKEKEDGILSAKSVVEPLIHYLHNFGESDRENSWRLEITVAEVLAEDRVLDEALIWARQAKSHAPETFFQDINHVIAQIETIIQEESPIALIEEE